MASWGSNLPGLSGQHPRASLVALGATVAVLLVGLVWLFVGSGADATPKPRPTHVQRLFSQQIARAQARVDHGNAVTLVSARRHRDHALCARVLPRSRTVHGWLGTLHGVSTSDEQGEITVSLADGVMLHTADSARLAPGTRPFEAVANLHDGDLVRFSGRFLVPGDGTCITSTNHLDKSGITSPDFLFRFRTVRPAQPR